jgi:hypothetical protein
MKGFRTTVHTVKKRIFYMLHFHKYADRQIASSYYVYSNYGSLSRTITIANRSKDE